MLRLLFFLVSLVFMSPLVLAEEQYFRVGQLVKCSYKGNSTSTKTVECQLKQGLDRNKIWRFSATNDDWDHLAAAAGKQVLIKYRTGGIDHMESDFSLSRLTLIDQEKQIKAVVKKPVDESSGEPSNDDSSTANTSVNQEMSPSSTLSSICKTDMPKNGYSVGFRVIRVLSAENIVDNIDEHWQGQGQLGGKGDMPSWSFKIRKKENQDCYRKLLKVMSSGKKHVFYYHQQHEEGIYTIWRIDGLGVVGER